MHTRSSKRCLTLLVLTASLVLAGSASADNKQEGKHKPPPPKVSLHVCSTVCADSFVINDTDNLRLISFWRHVLAGVHEQELKVLLPTGETYLDQKNKFNPVKSSILQMNLPVTGTAIQYRALAGKWKIQAYLDGQLIHTELFSLTLPPPPKKHR
jgi:hypothetical protein